MNAQDAGTTGAAGAAHRLLIVAVAGFAVVAGLAGCGKGTDQRGASSSGTGAPGTEAGSPPTLVELRNTTYSGLESAGAPITLVNGRWEGQPASRGGVVRSSVTFVDAVRLLGDLDGNGGREAAVLLAESSGGSGEFTYLAVVARDGTTLRNVATTPIGDRVQLRAARVVNDRIELDLVQGGEGDAACCPGDLVTRSFRLGPEGLSEDTTTVAPSRLSLDAIAGVEWILRTWDFDEPVDSSLHITLRFENGRMSGKACNSYFVSVQAEETPGDIKLGAIGATKMACIEPMAGAETRYFKLLGAVTKFGYMAGQLALTYESGGTIGTLLFDPAGGRSFAPPDTSTAGT